MVINTGESFPEAVGVVLARWAWRYRSELAPFGIALVIAGTAWWLHAAQPHWWLFIAVLAGVAAWVAALFGARIGLATRIERVYAAVTIYAAGVWLSVATALGRSCHRSHKPSLLLRSSWPCRGGRIGVGVQESVWSASFKLGRISRRP